MNNHVSDFSLTSSASTPIFLDSDGTLPLKVGSFNVFIPGILLHLILLILITKVFECFSIIENSAGSTTTMMPRREETKTAGPTSQMWGRDMGRTSPDTFILFAFYNQQHYTALRLQRNLHITPTTSLRGQFLNKL